jgi:hypothetical protein
MKERNKVRRKIWGQKGRKKKKIKDKERLKEIKMGS